MTYDEVMSKLNPKTLAKIQRGSEISVERQPLPSLGLTQALDGGLRYGTQTVLWGPKSSGKSLLALQLIGDAQRAGKVCALIDIEKGFTPEWGTRLGMDVDKLVVSRAGSFEAATDASVDFLEAGMDIIAIDSLSALLPGSYLDDGAVKDAGKTNQIGQFSKDAGKMASLLNYVNKNSLIIYISQLRTQIGAMYSSVGPMGGLAMEHYVSTSIKLWGKLTEKEMKMGDVKVFDQVINLPIGRPVTWTLTKERGPGMGRSGEYDIYYAGDFIGVEYATELIDIAVLKGVIRKSGAWYYVTDDEKYQGKDNFRDALRADKDLLERLKNASA